MTINALANPYDIGVKGQFQIYLKSVSCPGVEMARSKILDTHLPSYQIQNLSYIFQFY